MPNNISEKQAKILLNLIPEIGSIRANRLLSYFGSASKIFQSTVEELQSIEGLTKPICEKIIRAHNIFDLEKEIKKADKLGINIITSDEDNYPEQLKVISDPPLVIYVLGEIKKDDFFSLSIVGTRKPTGYGVSVTEKLTKEFVESKITIISGLARGIDTIAHWTAVKNGGRTIGVLGNGLSICYPPENKNLKQKILDTNSGALISEFPIDTKPERQNFPQRNRLISALSLATIVIEGDITSGALITAKFALEQGKDVFAVPGSIFSKYSKGPHYLLQQGAKLVMSGEDVIREISNLEKWVKKKNKRKKETQELQFLNPDEQQILSFIELKPDGIYMDELSNLLKKSISVISQNLTSLELKGLIKSLPGKLYIKL